MVSRANAAAASARMPVAMGAVAAFAAGGASRWWLHHSLVALQKSLSALGGTLVVMHGPASKIVPQFVDKIGAKTVFWNRRYDPDGIETDRYLKTALQGAGVTVNSFNVAKAVSALAQLACEQTDGFTDSNAHKLIVTS